ASTPAVLGVAEILAAEDATALATLRQHARALGLAGLRVGRRDAGTGEVAAFWPLEPQVVRAVLLYAQAAVGARGASGGAYTFAVWNRPPADAAEAQAVVEAIARREPPRSDGLQLLPIAKVTTPADAAQAEALAHALRRHTLQKFGPVRSLRPALVAELGFDGVAASARHRSGLALQQPRLLRLREDAPLQAIGNLAMLQALVPASHRG
ncbi:MAG TPA: ATP-dependent DNA ligase, partial [Burkholderiaceae bacterium]|nr:ATP-dependent DNA ligase [Burkholderiaceae bacterium]